MPNNTYETITLSGTVSGSTQVRKTVKLSEVLDGERFSSGWGSYFTRLRAVGPYAIEYQDSTGHNELTRELGCVVYVNR